MKKADSAFYLCSSLGHAINAERKFFGYKNTMEFASAIREKTGYPVTKDTLYRIECGDQELTVPLLCAITLTLYGDFPPSALMFPMREAACETWQDIPGEANEEVGLPRGGFLVTASTPLRDLAKIYRAMFGFLGADSPIHHRMDDVIGDK